MGVTAPEVRRAGAAKRERRARYARMEEEEIITTCAKTSNAEIVTRNCAAFNFWKFTECSHAALPNTTEGKASARLRNTYHRLNRDFAFFAFENFDFDIVFQTDGGFGFVVEYSHHARVDFFGMSGRIANGN